MKERFTPGAKNAIEAAQQAAKELLHNYVGTEHLLIGLLEAEGVARKVLEVNGLKKETVLDLISQLIAPDTQTATLEQAGMTPRFKRIVANSERVAMRTGAEQIGTEHLLLALLQETDCIAVRLINTIGINAKKIFYDTLNASGADLNQLRPDQIQPKPEDGEGSDTPTLDQYSKDMTLYAKEGKIDPVVGRDAEIRRVIQILSRRTKNNPCLVGEPGVGKTAIVEGLAQRIVDGDVPDTVKGKRVVTLDLSGMVAGSKYRGEFEERIKRVIEEVTASGNVLLFLDELHTLIGAGGSEGGIDASNILKPSLARGELQLIGATTREEYRKYIEKNAALERRFQPVNVEEPTEEETVEILMGLRERYEEHHKIKITDEAVRSAAKLAARYINDRFLPDKAIDVMDEAASKVRMSTFTVSPKIRAIEEKLELLEQQKEDCIKKEAYEEAGKIKAKQVRERKKLEAVKAAEEEAGKQAVLTVAEADIANVVSTWTKIPVEKLAEEESERLLKLESILHKRVVGQEEAVSAVAKAIRRGRVGLKDPNRPIGSFLFLGPTGVGKTELSKALAEAMFGNENAVIRVDMSEYMEKHSVSKLIGSPPGYVGYDEGGQLSEKIRRNPYSVLLFDEIEKAHPDVFNILLQILDDGHVTDAHGRKVSFKNTIIIMTSNAGAQNIISPKKLGFITDDDAAADYKRMKDQVMDEVKRLFKPEFINRIDEIIVFHVLTKKDIREIVGILFDAVAKRSLEQMEIRLRADDSFTDFIVEKGYDSKYGARPLRRAIQNHVEDRLAEEILEGKVCAGDSVKVSSDGEKVIMKARKPASKKKEDK